MAVIYGTTVENGRETTYAEFDELVYLGDSYVIRVTAIHPYKNLPGEDPDALLCHIDFMNVTQGTSGRYANVIIPARDPQEPQGHLRRWSAIRKLQDLVNNSIPIASPVYP
jgi:hypothetical protein